MFSVGMRVMISNDNSYYNGLIGTITKINLSFHFPYVVKCDELQDRPFRKHHLTVAGKLSKTLFGD